MKISSSQFSSLRNNPKLVFNLIIGLLVFGWLIWYYVVSLSGIKVEQHIVKDKPLINADPQAYKITEGYLKAINAYKLPDLNTIYPNTEPFTEYPR